jgi:hypothetical protein
MNSSSMGPRTTKQLSESLVRRVNAYALVAGAAGVSVMALTQPSNAEIVYTPAHGNVPFNGVVPVDLNHDGIPDFKFTIQSFAYHSFHATFEVLPMGNGVMASSKGDAAPLPLGDQVGGSRVFKHNHATLARSSGFDYNSVYSWHSGGPWANQQNRYLGVEFEIGGVTHYGWIRLSVTLKNFRQFTATITGFAYETVAGKAILTGQVASESSAVLPNSDLMAWPSLGAMALGSSGLQLWRRDS